MWHTFLALTIYVGKRRAFCNSRVEISSTAYMSTILGKPRTGYCTYCLAFYREIHGRQWGSSSRVVEITGCSRCQERHIQEVSELKAEMESLQLKLDHEKTSHETDLAEIKEKSRLDLLVQKGEYELLKKSHETVLAGLKEEVRSYLLNQKAEYEQLNAKQIIEMKNLKADNNDHLTKIEFLKMRRDSSQGDVIIAVSESRILAHRTILAEKSPVFEKLLQSCCSERQTKEKPQVKLEYCSSSPILEAIVNFCYSGEIAFSELVPPREVLKAAHTFQLGFLSELTEAELCRAVSVDNVPEMLKLARECSALRLQEEAGKLFKEHFDILSSKVYEVLQGPHSSTPSEQVIPKSSPELDEQCPSDSNRLVDTDEQILFRPDTDNTFS